MCKRRHRHYFAVEMAKKEKWEKTPLKCDINIMTHMWLQISQILKIQTQIHLFEWITNKKRLSIAKWIHFSF